MKNGNEGRIPASEFEPDNGVSSSPSATGAPYGSLGEAALYYLSQGLSVIPLREREKIPMVSWDEYQTKRPAEDEVRRWWTENPSYNIGIVTGRVSGNLVVIDFDDLEVAKGILGRVGAETPGVAEKLKHTWVVRTGKGLHVYVRAEHPEAMPRTRSGAGTRVDFRADGGQVVAPPSVHPSGRRYEWMEGHAPWQTGVAVLTDEEMAQLLRIVAPWYTYAGTTQEAAQEGEGRRPTPLPPPTRELSDDEVNEIAEALKEFMTPGHRNPINYKLTAMMIENGIKRESAKKVIGTLMAMALTPEDPVDRLEKEIANVDYHYRNDPNERRLEGRPSLMAECAKALVDAGMPLDAAVKRADAAVGRVTAVLKGRPEPKPPEETPGLWDKMEWWRRNFLLTTEGEGGVGAGGEKPKTADVAARVADGMVDGAMIEFVAICTPRGCELYAKDGHTLVDAGVVIEMALGAPGVRRFAGVTLPTLIRWNLLNRARRAVPEELNPPEWLNTPAGVLDLRSLELIPPGEGGPYFTYVIPAVPDPVVLGRIRRGEYRIEENVSNPHRYSLTPDINVALGRCILFQTLIGTL
ncbi:MAG: bifunctional DNA primase/polymerase [Conexivisphaera sp.]